MPSEPPEWFVLDRGAYTVDVLTVSSDSMQRSTFEESSLELLPALAPLLNRPPEVAGLARQLILEGLGCFASPREIILAVGEQIEDLLEVERALAVGHRQGSDSGFASDADDDDDAGGQQSVLADVDEVSDKSDTETETESVDGQDGPIAALDAQLPTLVRLLALRVPQMKGRKALPTVMHLSSLLRPAISRFASHRPPVGPCREVAIAVTRLVAVVHDWAQTRKDDWSPKGEQAVRFTIGIDATTRVALAYYSRTLFQSLLLDVLSDTIVRLRPGLNLKSIERVSSLQGVPPATVQTIGRKSLPGLGDWPEGLDEIAVGPTFDLPREKRAS